MNLICGGQRSLTALGSGTGASVSICWSMRLQWLAVVHLVSFSQRPHRLLRRFAGDNLDAAPVMEQREDIQADILARVGNDPHDHLQAFFVQQIHHAPNIREATRSEEHTSE